VILQRLLAEAEKRRQSDDQRPATPPPSPDRR
jgi:hypothetical protein